MSLKTYHAKRHFDKTAEPKGKASTRSEASGRGFVVQKHAASHLHYDFRLELEGVLKSWAVPKGPSLDPADKRLAVEVEDHPIEYATFEGTIPQGQYGGGTVMVWDRGSWTPKPGTNPHAALRAGKLEFELRGEKLRGAWMLLRMGTPKPGTKPQWLLRKVDDVEAKPAAQFSITEKLDRSVATGRSIEQIAVGKDPQWQSNRRGASTSTAGQARSTKAAASRPRQAHKVQVAAPSDGASAVVRPMPKELSPQLATLVDQAPKGPEWIHEVKFDGYRILAFVSHGKVRLISRNGKDWTARFPQVVREVEALGVESAILDGEVVAVDAHGRSAFQLLQGTLKNSTSSNALAYYVFDLLYLNGKDLRPAPLHDRRAALEPLLHSSPARRIVRFSESIEGHGTQVLQQACKLALEGIISKRADAPYVGGRTTTWVKSKCTNRQEMVIGGFTDPQNTRTGLGALLIGHYQDGELRFAGKVGTGLDTSMLRSLTRRLKTMEQKSPPFVDPPRGAEARGAHWVRPELVCEVEFFEWTKEDKMRHPSFVELREDKPASEVVRERRKPVAVATRAKGAVARSVRRSAAAPAARKASSSGAASTPTRFAGIDITHADREVFPDIGVTKGELAAYYEAVSPWMLPHVKGRPLSVVRCPQGQGSQCFYQKNWERGETVGSHVATIRLASASIESLVIDAAPGLVWLVQRGVLEVHTWGCTEAAIEQPDRMVFDLDPSPELPWSAVTRAAKLLRSALDDRGLPSVVKTTGGKGLHVVVPLKPKASWDEVKTYSKTLADQIVDDSPDEYIATMSKAKRTGKIFIDYLRNNRGSTFVAPFSSRARAGAPVAMPMAWDDLLSRRVRPVFTVRDVPQLLAKQGDPWKGAVRPRVLPSH